MIAASNKYNTHLAEYFKSKTLYLDEPKKEKPNVRKLVEQPCQQTKAGIWVELKRTLTNFDFIDAKAKGGMIHDLLYDYSNAEWTWPGSPTRERKERIDKYVKMLVQFSIVNSSIRNGKAVDIFPLPSAPSSVIRISIPQSIKNDEVSTTIEWIRAWKLMVANHLTDLSLENEFSFQAGYNSAGSGPVAEMAERECQTVERTWARLLNRPPYTQMNSNAGIYEGSLESITSVAITFDGKSAITGGLDKIIRIWNLETGKSYVLGQHKDQINSVAITPDGRRAISGGNDNMIYVWDIESREISIFEGHLAEVTALAITPDGSLAVSGSKDMTVRIWDLKTGKSRILEGHKDGEYVRETKFDDYVEKKNEIFTEKLQRIEEALYVIQRDHGANKYSGSVLSIDMTPDGKWAISGSDDRTLRLWELESGKSRVLHGHTKQVNAVVISDDGKFAYSGSKYESQLLTWDLETGEIISSHNVADISSGIQSLAVTSDDKYMVFTNGDNSLHLWDLLSGEHRTIKGKGGLILTVAITPDGKYAVAGGGGALQKWNLEYEENLSQNEFEVRFKSFAMSPDWKHAIIGCYKNFFGDVWQHLIDRLLAAYLQVWDVETNKSRLIGDNADTNDVIGIMPDNNFAIIGRKEGLQLLNIETGEKQTLAGDKERSLSVGKTIIVPDGKTAVSNISGSSLLLSDIETGKSRFLEKEEDFRNINLAFFTLTPDGNNVIVVREFKFFEKTKAWLHICNIETGKASDLIVQESCLIKAMSVTPDGRNVLYSDETNTLWLYNLHTRNCIAIKKDAGPISAIAVMSDGKRAITGYANFLCVWDLETGSIIHKWTSSIESINAVFQKFSMVAARGFFGDFGLWKLENFPFPYNPYVTACRLWHMGDGNTKGHWDKQITVQCGHCAKRFVVPGDILDTIARINRKAGISELDSPCLKLPDSAWEESGLLTSCPKCGQKLRFNPFVLDNKGKPKQKYDKNSTKAVRDKIANNHILHKRNVKNKSTEKVICPECNSPDIVDFKKIKSSNITLVVLLVITISSLFLLLLSLWWLILVISLSTFTLLWLKAYILLHVCNNCGHKFFRS